GDLRGSGCQARAVRRGRTAPAPWRAARDQYLEPDTRDAYTDAGRPGTLRRAALLQSSRPDAADRGRALGTDAAGCAGDCARLRAPHRQAALSLPQQPRLP